MSRKSTLLALAGEMDRRYLPVIAHLTVLRFRRNMSDSETFRRFIEANRDREFGQTCVVSPQLVWNDWYLSGEEVRVLAEYPLA